MTVNVVPVGTREPSFSSFVTAACQALTSRGLRYQVTPGGTILEGDVDVLFEAAQEMHQASLQAGAPRVITSFTLDQRCDGPTSMERQVRAVTSHLPGSSDAH